MNSKRPNQGFTLIEVLIALVVLAVGLLGMASLMMTSLQSSQGAYQRSQASLLAYDIIERMRANHDQAVTSDAYALSETAATTSAPGCVTAEAGCNASEQAQLDLHQWRTALEAGIPGASAIIERTPPNSYEITMSWDEAGESPEATSFSLRVDL